MRIILFLSDRTLDNRNLLRSLLVSSFIMADLTMTSSVEDLEMVDIDQLTRTCLPGEVRTGPHLDFVATLAHVGSRHDFLT